jgi:hypothetical protein
MFGSKRRLLGQSIVGERPSSSVCSIAVPRALGCGIFDEADAAAMQG